MSNERENMTKRKSGKYIIPKLKIRMVRERARVKLSTPHAAAEAVRQLTCDDDPCVERFVVLFIDGRSQVVGGTVVAQGGRHGCALTASEVLRPAIVAGASGIIVGHNHPSGDPQPSSQDLDMTRTLVAAGAVVGIPIVDHVIVTDCGRSHSMLEHNEGGI